jgi:ribosomal protein S8
MEKLFEAIFEQAFADMPEEFTSKQFCNACRKYGLLEDKIRNGSAKKFLAKYAHRNPNFTRSWNKNKQTEIVQTVEKLPKPKQLELELELKEKQFDEDMLEEAIKIVKKAGLKVYKPETTFKEI